MELQKASWNATSSKAGKGPTLYAKERAWLSQGLYPCVLVVQDLVPATGTQVGTEAKAGNSAEWGDQLHTAKGK